MSRPILWSLVSVLVSGCLGGGSSGRASTTSDSATTPASAASPVFFTTGQNAALVISEADFNDAGYLNNPGDGLLFNHQKGIASDGTNLVVADGSNNRVLIWNQAPTDNTSPDVVLGQPDLVQTDTNNATSSLARISWPVDVAIGGGRLFVSDTENDRILVWNSIPTTNGQAADYAITNTDLAWPWGIWTDGTKLMVTSTLGGKVLVWNSIPATGTEAPDLILTSNGELGTPRTITTDGTSFLMVADHNPNRSGVPSENGVFYWTSFPTTDVASDDFFSDGAASYWMGGAIDGTGRLYWVANILHRFDTPPAPMASIVLGDYSPTVSFGQYLLDGGDGTDIEVVGNRLYISLTNKNKIVGYRALPELAGDVPDIVIGSNSLDAQESSLETRLDHITNPAPVCDSQRLIVASDFDRNIRFYNSLPTANNQAADLTMSLAVQPSSISYSNSRLLAFMQADGEVWVWTGIPAGGGTPPDVKYTGLGFDLQDVSLDSRYLYVLKNNVISIWDISSGFPADLTAPDVQVTLQDANTLMGTARRLRSGDTYVLVTVQDRHKVLVFERSTLVAGSSTPLGAIGGSISSSVQFNLPTMAILAAGKVFVADTGFHRVQVWDSVGKAISGQQADAVLGQANQTDHEPNKARDGLFMPASLCFNGQSLYVGEFKFSGRLLEYRGTP